MNNKHTIFAFVGASGSGKSTLMIELLNFFPHLSIIKSTSTRPRRDEMDDLFYNLVDAEYIANFKDKFLTLENFAGNHYAYEKRMLDEVLSQRCGMFAIIEPTIQKLINHGYDLTTIKVLPGRNWEMERTKLRRAADQERANANQIEFDFILENSFTSGGLEKSVEKLAEFVTQKIANHIKTPA